MVDIVCGQPCSWTAAKTNDHTAKTVLEEDLEKCQNNSSMNQTVHRYCIMHKGQEVPCHITEMKSGPLPAAVASQRYDPFVT